MEIGELLKRTRKDKGYTLKELSKKADISISFLSDIENGRSKPSLERLRDICMALECSVSYVLQENVEEKNAWNEPISQESEILDKHLELVKKLLKIEGFDLILKEFEGFEHWSLREKEEILSLLKSKSLYRNQ